MNWSPKKWIATALGFFAMPLGMLYVAQPLWAAIYIAMAVVIAVLDFVLLHRILSPAAMAVLQFALPLACAFHARQFATKFEMSASRPWYSKRYGLLGIAVAFLSAIAGIRAFLYEPFRLPSGSMLPSIEPGSYLIVKKWGYGHYSAYGIPLARTEITSEPKRGDVIVFEYPEDRSLVYTKRVLGLPGDRISYNDKRLSINGQAVEMRPLPDYLHRDRFYYSSHYLEKLDEAEYEILLDKEAPALTPDVGHYPFRERCVYDAAGLSCDIPPGHYFVMGDNRDASRDSRAWGFVPSNHIVGKVAYIMR